MNLVVATVAEDREPFRTEALYLFRSLRRLGGTLATAMARAHFVDSVDEAVEAERRLRASTGAAASATVGTWYWELGHRGFEGAR